VGVDLEEDILGEVLSVGRVAGKAVAEPVDAPMMGAHQLGPRSGITVHAVADDLGPVSLQRTHLRVRLAGFWSNHLASLGIAVAVGGRPWGANLRRLHGTPGRPGRGLQRRVFVAGALGR